MTAAAKESFTQQAAIEVERRNRSTLFLLYQVGTALHFLKHCLSQS